MGRQQPLTRLPVELRVVTGRVRYPVREDGDDAGDRHHQRPLGELDLLLRRRDAERITDGDERDHDPGRDRDPPEGGREPVKEGPDRDDQPEALQQDLGIGQSKEQRHGEQAARQVDQTAENDRVQMRESRETFVPRRSGDGHPSSPKWQKLSIGRGSAGNNDSAAGSGDPVGIVVALRTTRRC